jgi:hypothetical protein
MLLVEEYETVRLRIRFLGAQPTIEMYISPTHINLVSYRYILE